MRQSGDDMPSLPISQFKQLVREQYFMLLLDSDAAIAAIPAMLPPELETRGKALELISTLARSRGELPPEGQARLLHIAHLFGSGREPVSTRDVDDAEPRARTGAMRTTATTTRNEGLSA